MISIFLSLLCAFMMHLSSASASLVDQTQRAIYRRNDASDDEWEFFDSIVRNQDDENDSLTRIDSGYEAIPSDLEQLENYLLSLAHEDQDGEIMNYEPNVHSVASKHSDHDLIQSSRDRKRKRISHEATSNAGLKTTGLDLTEAPKEDCAPLIPGNERGSSY